MLPRRRLVGLVDRGRGTGDGGRGRGTGAKYSSTVSLTSTPEVGGWLTPRVGSCTHAEETR
jgi:hypothetical protein